MSVLAGFEMLVDIKIKKQMEVEVEGDTGAE
jgi:hypothetical protein